MEEMYEFIVELNGMWEEVTLADDVNLSDLFEEWRDARVAK